MIPRAWKHRPDGQRAGHRDTRLETALRDLLEEIKQRILPYVL